MATDIFLSHFALSSPQRTSLFFRENESTFCQKPMQLRALAQVGGYLLRVGYATSDLKTFNTADELDASTATGVTDSTATVHSDLEDVTHKVMGQFLLLLQNSPVHDAVRNVAKYNSSNLPRFLLWLFHDEATNTLRSKKVPLYVSLVNTFYAAGTDFMTKSVSNGRYTCDRYTGQVAEMNGQLILQAPILPNIEQLKFIVAHYADAARHEFNFLQADAAKLSNFSSGASMPLGKLELLVKKVNEDASYNLILKDKTFDEELYNYDIDALLLPLEEVSEALDASKGEVVLFSRINRSKVSSLIGLTREQGYILSLSPVLNTLEYSPSIECAQSLMEMSYVLQEARLLNGSYCSPTALRLELSDNEIVQYVHSSACNLHAMSQKDYTDWLAASSSASINAFVHTILSRHQQSKPYTLPASREIAQHVVLLLTYLLGDEISEPIEDKDVLFLLDKESVEILSLARKNMPPHIHDEIRVLYKCCDFLTGDWTIEQARTLLKHQYGDVDFTPSHDIAFDPPVTAHCCVRFLYLLSSLYVKHDNPSFSFESDLPLYKPPSVLVRETFLLQMVWQPHVELEHFVNAFSSPLLLAGISFKKTNVHDGKDYLPIAMFAHDFFGHAFFNNAYIDAPWKCVTDALRCSLIGQFQATLSVLSSREEPFTFLKYTVNSQDVLHLLQFLLFFILHEETNIATNARMRVLPSYPSRAFLEKKFYMFTSAVSQKNQRVLELRNTLSDLPDSLKALLPINQQSPFPFLLASWMFDSVLEVSKQSFEKRDDFDVMDVMSGFEEKLKNQALLFSKLEGHWSKLSKSSIITPEDSRLILTQSRFSVLARPDIQQNLHFTPLPWDLEAKPEALASKKAAPSVVDKQVEIFDPTLRKRMRRGPNFFSSDEIKLVKKRAKLESDFESKEKVVSAAGFEKVISD